MQDIHRRIKNYWGIVSARLQGEPRKQSKMAFPANLLYEEYDSLYIRIAHLP